MASKADFFQPRGYTEKRHKEYRRLLLDFVITGNLPLSTVEQPGFRALLEFLNPAAKQISRYTLKGDLFSAFRHHHEMLRLWLSHYTELGGRVSLTTVAWSARNYSDSAAVTVYWIDIDWQMNTCILNVVHLSEPGHTGEYLGAKLVEVTNGLSIRGSSPQLLSASCFVPPDKLQSEVCILQSLSQPRRCPSAEIPLKGLAVTYNRLDTVRIWSRHSLVFPTL